MKKRLPKGISNYEDLIEQGYYYVDKTEYIQKLESLSDKVLMFVRPRKFGKTLFTSVLENYYDKLKIEKFDEKYVKVLFFSIAMNMKNIYFVKSELEFERKYPDILMIPKKEDKGYKAILIEFKYLKRGEEEKLEEKQKQAREQVLGYSKIEEINKIKDLKKFAIVAVVDKAYIEEICF